LQIDGWSWPLLFREVGALYSGKTLPPAPPYRDYIEWQQRQSIAASQDFWKNYLRDFNETTPLPGRLTSGTDDSASFHEETRSLSAEATAALRDLARRAQVTLNVLVQTAWALLVARVARRDDIIFGASFSGRPADLPGVENIAGPFVNNLPVRVAIGKGPSLADLLRRVQTRLFELNEHQSTPLTQIQDWSDLPWHARLFDSLLVFQNYLIDDDARRLDDDVTIHHLVAPICTNYPLTIVAVPGSELALTAIAPGSAFRPPSLAQWLVQLTTLLEAMSTADATKSVGELQSIIPLPAVIEPALARARSGTFIAPRTPTEHAIAAVWREAFGVEAVGIQDNFFDLGGHSLLMIRVHARLREALQSNISVVRMFQHPTIESLARHVDGGQPQTASATGIAERAARQKAALARQRLIPRQP
jgi:non-ribosomal peptide synthetase component F